MIINTERVELENEITILGHAVMDSDVCASMYYRYKSGELRTGHFTKDFKLIFRWVIRYFAKHNKAPKFTIENIYKNRKKNLSPNQREIVEAYLATLADSYADEQEDALDPSYVRDELLVNFIREREMMYITDKVNSKIERGQTEEAEEILSKYQRVSIDDTDENLGVFLPLTRDDVLQNQDKAYNEEDVVYKFVDNQRALKYIIGDLRRSWLVAVTGIEKSGKSYLLEEMGYNAVMYQDKKVLKINLELSETLQRERLWKRITGATDSWQSGDNIYPVLDCENNQHGTCESTFRKAREKKKRLFENPGQQVYFEDHTKWVPCDICKDNPKVRVNATASKRFQPTIWYDHSVLKTVSPRIVKRAVKRHERFAQLDNYRVKCFPRFSVTFEEVRAYILRYIDRTKWVPDIIILDYLDIMAQENPEIRLDVDNKWKNASKLAGELNCLVLNADQANKMGRSQYSLDKMSTSESKTKDGHLDIRIALNQTDYEKDFNIARVNCLFHRHMSFNERHEVIITQRLEVSQPILDCTRIFENNRERKYFTLNKKYLAT